MYARVSNRIQPMHLQINEKMCSTLSQLSQHTHNGGGISILHTPSCTCFTSWKTKFPMSYKLFMVSYERSLCRDNAITLADDYFTVRGQKNCFSSTKKKTAGLFGRVGFVILPRCVFRKTFSLVLIKQAGDFTERTLTNRTKKLICWNERA